MRREADDRVPGHRETSPSDTGAGPELLLATLVLHWAEDPRHHHRPRQGIHRGDTFTWEAALTALEMERPHAVDVSVVPGRIGARIRHTVWLPDQHGHPGAPEPWLLDWAATEPDHVDPATLRSTDATRTRSWKRATRPAAASNVSSKYANRAKARGSGQSVSRRGETRKSSRQARNAHLDRLANLVRAARLRQEARLAAAGTARDADGD